MRAQTPLIKVVVLLVLFAAIATSSSAATIAVKGASSYGFSPQFFGAGTSGTFTGGSFSEESFIPSNDLGTLAYDFTFSVAPPAGSTSLTIDFPTAISGVDLNVLYCDSATTVPCGTLSGNPISGSLGPDGGNGQEFVFTDLSQLQGQEFSVIFFDSTQTPSFDDNGNPILSVNVPRFSATWGTNSVATPEPASLALLGIGLAALSGKLCRKLA
jgi:hypothetical protein